MAIADPIALPHAEALLECFRTTIADTINPPGEVCLRGGDIVNILVSVSKDECKCGLAWVRVANVYPSTSDQFPAPDQGAITSWPGRWAVALEMGVARCAPVGTAQVLPTCEAWTNSAQETLADAAAMRRAVACCYRTNPDTEDTLIALGLWEPLPIEGGCTGGTMTIVVGADDRDCCSEGSP